MTARDFVSLDAPLPRPARLPIRFRTGPVTEPPSGLPERNWSPDAILRRLLRVPKRIERAATLHHADQQRPSGGCVSVSDHAFAARIAERLRQLRPEGAWYFRGNIHVAAQHPSVFVDHRPFPDSSHIENYTVNLIGEHFRIDMRTRPMLRLQRAILLKDHWDGQYWHLINYVLTRLALADHLGIDRAVPLVVSDDVYRRFRPVLQASTAMRGRDVIVQPPAHVLHCEELYVLRPGEFSPRWSADVAASFAAAPATGADQTTRVFCVRRTATSVGRTADNERELEEIFRDAGFRIADAAAMSIHEQKSIFGGAEIIAGINGAAFANAIFRTGRPLTIAAFISERWTSTAIPAFAAMHGFRYLGQVVPAAGTTQQAQVQVSRDDALRLIERIIGEHAGA